METKKEIKTSIGGQALIEGIMMRGPKKTSMAVRKTDGSIYIETNDTVSSKSKIKKIPLVRGVFVFVESMISGYKALMRSAEISMPTEEEAEAMEAEEKAKKAAKKAAKKNKGVSPATDPIAEEPAAEPTPEPVQAEASVNDAPVTEEAPANTEVKAEENTEEKTKEEGTKLISAGGMAIISIVSVILSLALTIFLFKFIPETIYEWTIERATGVKDGYGWNLLRSAVTGILKIFILVGYMAAVSCMKDIKRTFMYHGAEHKTIFCYEKGEELTVENVRRQTRFHPRCGTSFIVLSVLVSIFFTMFIPAHLVEGKLLNTLARTGISILLLPLIMGVGYELIRFAGKHENQCTKILSAPGVWLQHITTKEPDDSMIECAIAAVKEVIPDDGSDQIE